MLSERARSNVIYPLLQELKAVNTFWEKVLQINQLSNIIPMCVWFDFDNQTPAWVDDFIMISRSSKQQHREKLMDFLWKLEETG